MDIRLFSGNGMRAALAELGPQFERMSGHTLVPQFDPAKVVLRRVDAGESADVALLGEDVLESLVERGKIDPQSRRRLVRNGIGVAVRTGALHPNISTLEDFREALVQASSVAFTTEGASGMYFAQLIEQLGIVAAVRAKARTQPGGLVGELIVSGDAELAIQQIPELLAVPGIDLVGPLPTEVQRIGVTAGGVFVGALAADAGAALLDFLRSPAAVAVFRARGFEPIA